MTSTTFSLWCPRVLGFAVAAFLALFALDAFEKGRPVLQSLAAFAMHLLPAFGVLTLVAISWRWQWVSALGFIALAALYAAQTGRLDWVLVISGPLLLVGLLFLWSWSHHGHRLTLSD